METFKEVCAALDHQQDALLGSIEARTKDIAKALREENYEYLHLLCSLIARESELLKVVLHVNDIANQRKQEVDKHG